MRLLALQAPQRHHGEGARESANILTGADQLTLYQWNARIARHYFCKMCSIYPFHRKRSAPDQYGINVMCLEDFDIDAFPVRRADGQDMPITDPDAREAWPGPRE